MAAKKKTRRATAAKAARKTTARQAPARPARAGGVRSGALSMNTAAPSFTVDDVERSLAWYRDVLGFAVKKRWETDGRLEGVELAAGKVLFMLGQDDWKKGRDRVKGQGVRIYCTTGQDVDRLAERVKSKGGSLAKEPTDEWGMRSLSVDDPDGYKITIAAKSKR